MIFRVSPLLAFIKNTGMKNSLYALIDQPLNMAVRQFCRIAFGFGRDGIHA